ncbi:MAG: hopanoid biosynthesis-associated RND transporter HpnN [Alphaproteobacteria bacterium]|nr:hopanoid biosynthesis-associated RND transporter HpnN [Alphaproteobacteria bacterium]
MLISILRRIVGLCSRFPWPVVVASAVLGVAAAIYAASNFAISTDINKLISSELDWRKRELAFEATFPDPFTSILVVVNAPTTELASQAASVLTDKLSQDKTLFRSVRQLDGGPFFAKNGLLFQSPEDLAATTRGLAGAGPMIGALSNDPTLRGLTRALSFGMLGVQSGGSKLDDLVRPLNMSADTLDRVLGGQPASFSWNQLLTGKTPEPKDLRRLIEIRPVLDYSALEPGRAASNGIRKAVEDLKLADTYRARVRLTGPVAMADDEFGTVQEGHLITTILTIVSVLLILWIALRSYRIIVAVFANLFVGLSLTAALGLMMVGALNPISIAFAVLFVGIGVDFGIQFAVRYRAERHDGGDLKEALLASAGKIGAPLTLAAAAVTVGFMSFFPTDYKGLSELGVIAGMGMVIAYLTSLTLLPALLTLLKPPGEPEPIGYKALAPADRFIERYRLWVIGGTAGVAVLGLPLLYLVTFDFNPMNLRSPKVESVATFLDLRSDPAMGANAINIVVPNVKETGAVAERLKKIPEVDRVMSVTDFVPADQDKKLAMLSGLSRQLRPILDAEGAARAPTDAQNVAALQSTAATLIRLAGTAEGPGATAAKRLAANLTTLAQSEPGVRERAESAFVIPLRIALGDLREYLQAQRVTLENLPKDIVQQWISAGGRTRVEATPKGDPNDNDTLRHFAAAILGVFPEAVGSPISILESGDTVVTAFIQAGLYSLVAIAILLWIVLRRVSDVLLTLVPLLLAGVLTLEICVLIGLPLNFANIIALPLLLGVGVAFKIYYTMAWRAGQTDLLQSSLTRAVIWSALTTAVAFGSLWLSSHPGTSSMGKLLALSLVTTLAAAVLFQPALMGKPREEAAEKPPEAEKLPEPEKPPELAAAAGTTHA